MAVTRALIAEDEPLLAQSLQAALALAWPELRIVAIAANGPEALRLAEAERPDVAFLDIRMPGMSGLEVAAELADRLGEEEAAPRIVFVTAYDEYALRAFELAAVDYLLKPVSATRLAAAVARLKAQLAGAAPQAAGDLGGILSRLQAALNSASPNARANSAALANRSAGNFSSAPNTAASTCAGTDLRSSVKGRAGSVRILATMACTVLPVKGGSPASIS